MDRRTFLLPLSSLTGLLRYLLFYFIQPWSECLQPLLGMLPHCRSNHTIYSQAGFADPNLPVAIVRPADFEDAAKQACQTKLENAKSTFPRVDEGNLPYLCMDLIYQYTLLVDGFGRFNFNVGIAIMTFLQSLIYGFIFLHSLLQFVGRHISMARDYIGEES